MAAKTSGIGYNKRGGRCLTGTGTSDALDPFWRAGLSRDASSEDGLIRMAPYVDEELDGGSLPVVIALSVCRSTSYERKKDARAPEIRLVKVRDCPASSETLCLRQLKRPGTCLFQTALPGLLLFMSETMHTQSGTADITCPPRGPTDTGTTSHNPCIIAQRACSAGLGPMCQDNAVGPG